MKRLYQKIAAGARRLLTGKSAKPVDKPSHKTHAEDSASSQGQRSHGKSHRRSQAPRHQEPSSTQTGGPRSANAPDYILVDKPAQLAQVYAALDMVKEVSLDTEADNLYHFRTRVCLLQLMAGKQIFLIDLLADLPLDPLWKRLSNLHLIMHGSDFDLRLLHDLCDFTCHDMFDTMLAGQLINLPRVGLAALLEQHFGVALSKDSQKANWSKRPFTQKMLDYAALDVYHLPALRDILESELRRLGRLDWMKQRCRSQIETAKTGFPENDENAWRIGRADKLKGRGLCVLWAVWHWREATAERIDVPPFKVTSAELLTELALRADEGKTLDQILDINLGKRHERLIGSLEKAVAEGLEKEPSTLPPRRKRDTTSLPLNSTELDRQDKIKAHRDKMAKELNLEATLIANRAQLAVLAREPSKLRELLLPWQADLLAQAPGISDIVS